MQFDISYINFTVHVCPRLNFHSLIQAYLTPLYTKLCLTISNFYVLTIVFLSIIDNIISRPVNTKIYEETLNLLIKHLYLSFKTTAILVVSHRLNSTIAIEKHTKEANIILLPWYKVNGHKDTIWGFINPQGTYTIRKQWFIHLFSLMVT